jgi:hypothetical protein
MSTQFDPTLTLKQVLKGVNGQSTLIYGPQAAPHTTAIGVVRVTVNPANSLGVKTTFQTPFNTDPKILAAHYLGRKEVPLQTPGQLGALERGVSTSAQWVAVSTLISTIPTTTPDSTSTTPVASWTPAGHLLSSLPHQR